MIGRPQPAARPARAAAACRLLAGLALLAALSFGGLESASAQDDAGPPPRVRTHVERAPDGSLRRGHVDVPAWAPFVGGALVALGAGGLLVWRMRRR